MQKILVVDDQTAIQELIKVTLESKDCSVLTVGTGKEALKLAKNEMPDLILLDINLSELGMNGLDVCRKLKGDAATKHIPIMILTASQEELDEWASYDTGADTFFTKPFSPMVLTDKVKEMLEKHAK